MRKKTYAEITSEHVNVFSGNKQGSFALPINDKTACKGRHVVLVANVKQTAIRVVDIYEKPTNGMFHALIQHIKKSKPLESKWELVKSAFPIGEKMNENTHVFDGTVFTNETGAKVFLMTALPVSIAEELATTGASLFGNVHKISSLDTVENMLFRIYATEKNTEPFWVVFPQGDGFRILLLVDGLPNAAWYASNNPEYREGEILRFLQGHTYANNKNDKKETALKRAVVLNTDLDVEWLYTLLAENGIEVVREDYCLSRFIS